MFLLRRASFYVALLGIALVTSLVVVMAARQLPASKPLSPPPTKPFEHGLGAAGIVEAKNENTVIGVPVSAVVETVFVKVSDRIKAGDPLIQLDGRELRATLLTRVTDVKIAEARLAALRDQLDRQETLRTHNVNSIEAYRNKKFEVATSAAELDGYRAAEQQTRDLLARLTVRSPVDGTVLCCDVRVGEFLTMTTTAGGSTGQAASSPLVVGDIDTLQVRADVDEQVADRVRAGAGAVGFTKGDSSRPIALRFAWIEPYVQPKQSLTGTSTERVDTRVLRVVFQFEPGDPAHPVYVGQQLDVFISEDGGKPQAAAETHR